jgi:hypothetical protein
MRSPRPKGEYRGTRPRSAGQSRRCDPNTSGRSGRSSRSKAALATTIETRFRIVKSLKGDLRFGPVTLVAATRSKAIEAHRTSRALADRNPDMCADLCRREAAQGSRNPTTGASRSFSLAHDQYSKPQTVCPAPDSNSIRSGLLWLLVAAE